MIQLFGKGPAGHPLRAAALAMCLTAGLVSSASAEPKTVAFLNVHLQNDNEGYQPTSDAEKARMTALEKSFKKQLEATGDYKFVPLSDALREKIAKGQAVGTCGGCEAQYGKEAGADEVAWIRVQKVSNLILNLNVYMERSSDGKTLYEKSVDMRGNDDESWARSLDYLLKNYFKVSSQPS
jgi:hypothetical protein